MNWICKRILFPSTQLRLALRLCGRPCRPLAEIKGPGEGTASCWAASPAAGWLTCWAWGWGCPSPLWSCSAPPRGSSPRRSRRRWTPPSRPRPRRPRRPYRPGSAGQRTQGGKQTEVRPTCVWGPEVGRRRVARWKEGPESKFGTGSEEGRIFILVLII